MLKKICREIIWLFRVEINSCGKKDRAGAADGQHQNLFLLHSKREQLVFKYMPALNESDGAIQQVPICLSCTYFYK